SYAVVLVLRPGEGPIPRWLTTLGTVVIAALFIDELVQRVRRHAAASDETAAKLAELLSQQEVVARQDELTMLPNRRAWEEEPPRRLAAAARAGEEICVAMLDLDRFKVFNDSHGHQAGDHMLRDVA